MPARLLSALSRRRSRTLAVATLATCGVVLPLTATTLTAPPASAGAYVSSRKVALTWAPEYMSSTHSYSRSEAVTVAKRFDLVVAMPVAFKDKVSAMRSANSDLHLLSYANGMFGNSGAVRGLSDSAYAHDLQGHRIKSRAFDMYLMEPSRAAWRSRAAALCTANLRESGYEGCLFDMLTMGIFSRGYVTALPKVPGTSRLYSQTAWRSQLIGHIRSLRDAVPGRVLGNAVSNEFRYWDADVTSQPTVEALPGAQMEDFLRGARDSAGNYPSASDWRKNVEVIKDFERDGRTGLFSTKLWASHSGSQTAQWQAYAMSSFLMGANGHSYFAFTDARSKAGSTGTDQPYRMPSDLGSPTSVMVSSDGVYRRPFSNGMALTNPTGTSRTVALARAYTDLRGNRVSRVLLAPHSGQVLRDPA